MYYLFYGPLGDRYILRFLIFDIAAQTVHNIYPLHSSNFQTFIKKAPFSHSFKAVYFEVNLQT